VEVGREEGLPLGGPGAIASAMAGDGVTPGTVVTAVGSRQVGADAPSDAGVGPGMGMGIGAAEGAVLVWTSMTVPRIEVAPSTPV
jgi:hypothetical protein